jgi:hypothetical protein
MSWRLDRVAAEATTCQALQVLLRQTYGPPPAEVDLPRLPDR